MTALASEEKKGRKPGTSRGFVQVWTDRLVADTIDLPARAIQTFLLLANRMDPRHGRVFVDLADLNSELGYAHTTQVSAMIAALVKADLVRRDGNRWLRVNPNVAWRGKGGDRTVASWSWHNEANQPRR